MTWHSESGQASTELMGMLWWLMLAVLVVWQLMLAAWTTSQASNAARTASRVSARGGDPEKAARHAVSSPLRKGFKDLRMRGDRATVILRIPILVPGLYAEDLTATRSAELPS